MGSQLTKDFEVDKDPKSEGGITGAWKIYAATRRDRERTPVSIFTFDKRLIEKKPNKQEIINRLKAEISSLIRLRHPNLLQVLEPMLEDKTTLAWVTEPLEYCLGDLLRRPYLLSTVLGDTEVRLGILDSIQGLSFLHDEAGLVHMALCPDNIYVSLGGKWKIGGLNFCSSYRLESPGKLENVNIINSAKELRYQIEVDKISPLLHFVSPELLSKSQAMPSSDIFALGCSIYSIYKALSNTSNDLHLLNIEDYSVAGHLSACRSSANSGNPAFSCLPDTMGELVVKMTCVSANERSSLHELSVSKTLQTPYVKAIYYLEHLQEKQESQKMQFFKGLNTIIAKFDKVIMFKRLLPALLNNMQHPNLSPQILQNILTILKTCAVSNDVYQHQIWPAINKLASGKEIHAQSFYFILNEIDVLVKYTDPDSCKKTLMPLVFKGYDCAFGQIQAVIMEKTPNLIKELSDICYVKQSVLPKFLQAIVNSKTAAVKEAGLKSLALIYNQFDRSTMVETIIPSLDKFKKFDITGPMVMHMLVVYEGISKILGAKAISVNILPALLPLLVEAELSKSDFEKLFNSVIGMLNLIKDLRSGELTDAKDDDAENLKNEEVEVDVIFGNIFEGKSIPSVEEKEAETRKESREKAKVEKKATSADQGMAKVGENSFQEFVAGQLKGSAAGNGVDPFSLDLGKAKKNGISIKSEQKRDQGEGNFDLKMDFSKRNDFPMNVGEKANQVIEKIDFGLELNNKKNGFPIKGHDKLDSASLDFGLDLKKNDDFSMKGQEKATQGKGPTDFSMDSFKKTDFSVKKEEKTYQGKGNTNFDMDFNKKTNFPSKENRKAGFEFLKNDSKPIFKPGPPVDDIFTGFSKPKEENLPKCNFSIRPESKPEESKSNMPKPLQPKLEL